MYRRVTVVPMPLTRCVGSPNIAVTFHIRRSTRMTQAQVQPQPTHRHADFAHHAEWNFRREALLWVDTYPVDINVHPLATELYGWLQQKGQFAVLTPADPPPLHEITNPHTYFASTLAALLAQTINAAHAFSRSCEPLDPLEGEIGRIRLYNEQVLYSTRFLEAATKQLLYCTQVPRKDYTKAALGALLAKDCRACRSAGSPPHNISLLGSLAHRYGLCREFEGCLFEHIKLVNRLRNTKSAHDRSQHLNIRSAAESRAELDREVIAAGNEFVHMLKHVSDLEVRMIDEMEAEIRRRHAAALQ